MLKVGITGKSGFIGYHLYNNLFLNKDFELIDDILFIKCEDSYLHLLKKLALSLKYIYKLFNIKQGVLRCGDDLIFNENNLIKFLEGEKYDFYGKSPNPDASLKDKKLLENLLKKGECEYIEFKKDSWNLGFISSAI